MKNIPKSFLSLVLALAGLFVGAATATSADQPNIIFIMADDLGYGDLGCYGQKIIQTPRLDRMAAEGMRFTQFYAGATVCAPSRCVLMTGKHTGHCKVRGNGGGGAQSLGADDFTVAELLKGAGYSTGLIGKWGLGDMQPEMAQGMPTRKGFDYFFGYANQSHAHNYYPAFLWRNESMVGLRNEVRVPAPTNTRWGIGAATVKVDYTHDLFATEALDWVREHKAGPFFLFLSLTIPHANNEATRMTGDGAEVPDYGIYADEDWPDQDKGQAAMITRMDRDVGRLLDLLKELSIAEDTLVIFTSDNGPHDESGHDTDRFDPSGPLRGMKRDLYEGGIRVPTIAWWPGQSRLGRPAITSATSATSWRRLPNWPERTSRKGSTASASRRRSRETRTDSARTNTSTGSSTNAAAGERSAGATGRVSARHGTPRSNSTTSHPTSENQPTSPTTTRRSSRNLPV